MYIFKYFTLLTFKLIFSCIAQCNSFPLDLQKIAQDENFYQITSFISENFTKVTNLNQSNFPGTPNKIYLFDVINQLQLYNSFKNNLKNVYQLQESLVVYYTSNLNETKSFLDYLVPQSSARKRPKCLVVYSGASNEEIIVIDILKYAWREKFLDFAVMMVDLDTIYHLNPFNDMIYQSQLLDGNMEIFPDKFHKGCYDYPFYISEYFYEGSPDDFIQIRRSKRKTEVRPLNKLVAKFTLQILNLQIIRNFTKNLDLLNVLIDSDDNFFFFLIPTGVSYPNFIAVVPILYKNFHVEISFKTVLFVSMIGGMIISFSYLFNRFKSGHIKAWDVIRLFFGQSIQLEPQKTLQRLTYLTVVIAFVKITNDLLLDLFTVVIKKEEIPFDNYKDLLHSNLKSYISYRQNLMLKQLIPIHPSSDDEITLIDLFTRSKPMSVFNCINMLKKWRNVSCLMDQLLAETYITELSAGSVVKIAQPPLWEGKHSFFWFSDGSPYATKFAKIIQRVKETNLLHGEFSNPIKKRAILDLTGKNAETNSNDGIKPIHMMTVLCLGLSLSIIVFIIELIKFKTKRKILKYLTNRYEINRSTDLNKTCFNYRV